VAVHIRLTRVGATRRPAYRVIAIDSRRSRDGRALEILGFYDPLSNPITVKLDDERIANWMARGARPSAAVQRLMKVAAAGPTLKHTRTPGAAETAAAKPRRAPRTKKTAAEPTAEAEPAVEAEPAAAPLAEDTGETPAEAALEPTSEIAPETTEGSTDADTEPTTDATTEPPEKAPDETAAETATESEPAEA